MLYYFYMKRDGSLDFDNILKTHLHLECMAVTPEGLLTRIEGPYPDDISRLYAAKFTNGSVQKFYRVDVPQDIRSQLDSIPVADIFIDTTKIKKVLSIPQDQEEWRGLSYVFPENLSVQDFPDVVLLDINEDKTLLEQFEPGLSESKHEIFAIVREGKIVSACNSSREDNLSAESWVRTLEEYRGKGYARQVTLAWAHNLQKQKKLPFYTHKLSNIQSRKVAEGLGLTLYMEDIGYQ